MNDFDEDPSCSHEDDTMIPQGRDTVIIREDHPDDAMAGMMEEDDASDDPDASSSISVEQPVILSEDQSRALQAVLAGTSVLITGPGGVGKTVLIRQIYEKSLLQGKRVAITALTGAAACLMTSIGARTLHSWGGIPVRDDITADEKARRIMRFNPDAMARWMKTDILVIDEVSMMSPLLAHQIDVIARNIRGYAGRMAPEREKPFGGLQVVFVGDFFQLPPVLPRGAEKTFIFEVSPEERARGKDGYPPFAQVIRSRSQVIVLRKNFRQQGDMRFQALLNRARYGVLTPDDVALLETRVISPPKEGVIPTRIFPTKRQVEELNAEEMRKLDKSTERVYQATTMERFFVNERFRGGVGGDAEMADGGGVGVRKMPVWKVLKRTLRDKLVGEDLDPLVNPGGFTEQSAIDELDKAGRFDPNLKLRLGAQVMITYNIDMKAGIVNGTRGVVRGLDETLIKIELRDGRMYHLPKIVFESGYGRLGRSQFPVIAAWAITTHKSQGITLDSAEIDLGARVFAEGQAYVALSRVRSLEGLFLQAFNPLSIRASPIVLEFGKTIGDVLDE